MDAVPMPLHIIKRILEIRLELLVIATAIFMCGYQGFAYAKNPEVKQSKAIYSKDTSLRSDFEKEWSNIKTCSIKFYSPEAGEEDFEGGIIHRYLSMHGYQILDSGEGYRTVPQFKEMLLGYSVESLTLPGEWGVYGMDVIATADEVRRSMFPTVDFKKQMKAGQTAPRFESVLREDAVSSVTLVLNENRMSQTKTITTVSCFIELGN